MSTSLRDYTDSPLRVPSPFPPQSARKSTRAGVGAWPSDTLPAEAIAVDLARSGVTFQRGLGYAVDGAYREADQVALLAVEVLSKTADRLLVDRVAKLAAYVPVVERSFAANYEAALDSDASEDQIAYDVGSAHMFGGGMVLDLLDATDLDPALDAETLAERYAIRATATELSTSIAARSRLLARIRPYLPAPSIDSGDPDAATAFLVRFDRRGKLRRSELAARYAEAASPGNLSPAAFRELAADRWGTPRKLDGYATFRPVSANIPTAVVSIAPAAPPSNFDQALTYASGRLALFGDLPDAETLGEIFALDPDEAAEVLKRATRATTTLSAVQ